MCMRFRWPAVADEFSLSEPMIQLIQSFLTSKQAARTTLLSKSWHNAWLTRPNLDFDQADFCRGNYVYKVAPKFLEFAEKTLERYDNSNLKIESFRLSIKLSSDDGYDIAEKLVNRALKLGPTRLTLEFQGFYFDIPEEVFRDENLFSLAVTCCLVNLNSNREVCCSRLQFLSFESVCIESRDTLFHIISSCPLIEKLSLCDVYVDGHGGPLVGDNGPPQTINLHRLESLVLKDVNFDTVFLADLSSKFPSLIDLTLYLYEGPEEILISSPTLERLNLNISNDLTHMVKLDIPSIRKLTFVCSTFPDELSVKSNSRGWESCVSVEYCQYLNASWFHRLSNFIEKFTFSRISLSLHVYPQATTFDYKWGYIQGLTTPEIDNLNIYHQHLPTTDCYTLFDGLFRICHPKVITQYMSTAHRYVYSYDIPETNTMHFLVTRLLEARDAKVPTPNQFMYGLNDLKEARAQVFDHAVSMWRDVTLESVLDDSTTPKDEPLDELSTDSTTTYETDDDSTYGKRSPVFRIQLNWKQ